MTTFYTYMWLRENGTPYYIGKGKGNRAFHSDGHGVHRPKSRARIILQHWASESEAFLMEKWWIRLFGRQDKGTGILRNRTDGGEGAGHTQSDYQKQATRKRMLGVKLPESWRKAISAGRIGKKFGPQSEAHKAAISAGNLGKHRHPRPLVTIETRKKLRQAALKQWEKFHRLY